MKLNTVIRLPDGRIGTTCYNHLDGWGGVVGGFWETTNARIRAERRG
jgi:hypothetical protein